MATATTTTSLPSIHNFKIKAGDTFRRTFTFTEDGDPLDLSGCTITMQIRKNASGPVLKELSIGDGFTVAGGGSNVLYLETPWDIDEGTYKYDMQFVFSGGYTKTYFEGKISASTDYTTT